MSIREGEINPLSHIGGIYNLKNPVKSTIYSSLRCLLSSKPLQLKHRKRETRRDKLLVGAGIAPSPLFSPTRGVWLSW